MRRLSAVLLIMAVAVSGCASSPLTKPRPPREPATDAALRLIYSSRAGTPDARRIASRLETGQVEVIALPAYELTSVASKSSRLFPAMRSTTQRVVLLGTHGKVVGTLRLDSSTGEWLASDIEIASRSPMIAWRWNTVQEMRSRLGTSCELRDVSGNANAVWVGGRSGSRELGKFFNPTCLMDLSQKPMPRAKAGVVYEGDRLASLFVR